MFLPAAREKRANTGRARLNRMVGWWDGVRVWGAKPNLIRPFIPSHSTFRRPASPDEPGEKKFDGDVTCSH